MLMRIPLSVRPRLALSAMLTVSLVLGTVASADDRLGIELNGHLVTALGPAYDVPAELKAFAGDPGSDLLLIKFPGPVTADQVAALEARAERVFTYLPSHAFLVRLAPQKADAFEAAVGAAWTAPFHPAYKIGPGAEVFRHAKHRDRKGLMVQVFPDADLDGLRADLERLGARVTAAEKRQRFSRLRLLVNPAELAQLEGELARRPEVFFFDLEARKVLLNDTTAWVSQTGVSGGQQTPIHDAGILGEGQIVGVLDTGIDPDMCFFRDPVNGLPPRNECNGGTVVNLAQRKVIAVDFLYSGDCSGGISSNEWDNQDHGTHVAGTVAGDNFANPGVRDSADGMAPAAKLVVQDGGFATDNCADLPALGCPVVDLNPIFQQAYDQGARIHSNSWGDDENNSVKGLYSAGSEDSDEFMWNHKDFLLVYAAGNDGPGNGRIGSPATAKNVVAVGATLRGSSAESMASFSSCGPTQDGRIKPDVTLPGSSIVSANSDNNIGSNNCNTKSSSGTSMAAPGVAGAAALVREYFVDGFYPSGSANAGDSLVPSAALLKATLVSSGQNMTGVSGWPANCEGWGRVALDDALELSGDARDLFVDDNAGFPQGSSGATVTYDLVVGSSSQPLKVTLVWTDYPSTPAAGTTLVNDLDLEVTGPGGTYRGNVFSGGQSTPGGSADRLNTVEQVLLASPTAGSYTVTVRSHTVPQGPQPFALVATGDVSECTPPGCQPGNTAPSVTITSPSNGSSSTDGDSVSFSGSATDAEDGNLSSSLSWSSSRDGVIGSGASFSTGNLSVGSHTITASVTDSGSATGQDSISITVNPVGGGCGDCIDWTTTSTVSFSNQDSAANFTVLGADSIRLDDNTWRRTTQTWNVTANTVVEFDFASTSQGEIHGIGFDEDDTLSSNRIFKVHGTQSYGITDFDNYTSGTVTYSIPVGQYFTGSAMYLVLVNDNDAGSGNNSTFTNVRVFETGGGGGGGGGGGTCAVDDDFESGSAGWINGASATCSTGAFVQGTPSQQTSTVVTQPGGDHTSGSGNALYTASNTSAGADDVDGGECVLESPTWSVSAASNLSVWYFHGQRDTGDDASGDYFVLEMSTNGGSSYSPVVSLGDTRTVASWTEATATIPAGSSVKLRLRVSDGAGPGDIIEGGIDDLSICPQ